MSPGAGDNVRALGVAQVLPDRSTPVGAVRVSAVGADSHVVVAVGGETVAVYDIASARVIATHSRHKGANVTCVAVDVASGRVVTGDDRGVVVVADTGLVAAGGASSSGSSLASGFRSLFKQGAGGSGGSSAAVRDMPTAVVAGLDPAAPIVQLQFAPSPGDDLTCAVSTTTRACLFRIPAAARGAALSTLGRGGAAALACDPVGKKPRDGDFGVVFEPTSCAAVGPGVIKRLAFAARPAKRLWVVDVESASVLSTIKCVPCGAQAFSII